MPMHLVFLNTSSEPELGPSVLTSEEGCCQARYACVYYTIWKLVEGPGPPKGASYLSVRKSVPSFPTTPAFA